MVAHGPSVKSELVHKGTRRGAVASVFPSLGCSRFVHQMFRSAAPTHPCSTHHHYFSSNIFSGRKETSTCLD